MIELLYKVTCAWCGKTVTDTNKNIINSGWRTITMMPGNLGVDLDSIRGSIDVICNDCVATIQSNIDELTTAQQKLIQVQASKFSDDDALKYQSLFPEWYSNHSYAKNDRVLYNGVLYKCINSHTSQDAWTPDASPSLWANVLPTAIEGSDDIPEWVQPGSTNGYSKGDRVKHYSQIWESLVDNNVWEPGVVGTESLWKAITASPSS